MSGNIRNVIIIRYLMSTQKKVERSFGISEVILLDVYEP